MNKVYITLGAGRSIIGIYKSYIKANIQKILENDIYATTLPIYLNDDEVTVPEKLLFIVTFECKDIKNICHYGELDIKIVPNNITNDLLRINYSNQARKASVPIFINPKDSRLVIDIACKKLKYYLKQLQRKENINGDGDSKNKYAL